MFPTGNTFHSLCRELSRIAHTCRIRREKRAPGLGITWGKVLPNVSSTARRWPVDGGPTSGFDTFW